MPVVLSEEYRPNIGCSRRKLFGLEGGRVDGDSEEVHDLCLPAYIIKLMNQEQ